MSDRVFVDAPAVREQVPLWLGLIGASGSGKTFSALRLAAGIQSVAGGEVFVIDTEARRALHYAEKFKFRHVPFAAPFGPLDYLAAIEHCVAKGARTIVVDSMSHEHEGPGGVLEIHDQLEASKGKLGAWAQPKAERRRLINTMLQLRCNFILCFRAKEKVSIAKGGEDNGDGRRLKRGEPIPLGWQAIGADEYVYEMIARALLPPGSNGVPQWTASERGEELTIKLPEQFRTVLTAGELSESMGYEMAKWARGGVAPDTTASRSGAARDGVPLVTLLAGLADCADVDAWRAEYGHAVKRLDVEGKAMVAEAGKRRREELRRADAPPDDEPPHGALASDREEYTPQ